MGLLVVLLAVGLSPGRGELVRYRRALYRPPPAQIGARPSPACNFAHFPLLALKSPALPATRVGPHSLQIACCLSACPRLAGAHRGRCKQGPAARSCSSGISVSQQPQGQPWLTARRSTGSISVIQQQCGPPRAAAGGCSGRSSSSQQGPPHHWHAATSTLRRLGMRAQPQQVRASLTAHVREEVPPRPEALDGESGLGGEWGSRAQAQAFAAWCIAAVPASGAARSSAAAATLRGAAATLRLKLFFMNLSRY